MKSGRASWSAERRLREAATIANADAGVLPGVAAKTALQLARNFRRTPSSLDTNALLPGAAADADPIIARSDRRLSREDD